MKTAEETYGRLDIAFNNAGIMLADDSDSIATSEETIDKTLAVNLKGVLYGCRHQIPAMRRAGGGSIINTASFVASVGAAHPANRLHRLQGGGAVDDPGGGLAVIHAR